MFLVPGRNITTVGLYRDIRKWHKTRLTPTGNAEKVSLILSGYRLSQRLNYLGGKHNLKNAEENVWGEF